VNVRADGAHAGGFLASTSVTQSGGGNAVNNVSQGVPANSVDAPWTNVGNQNNIANHPQDGVTITHTQGSGTPQSSSQLGHVTTVTPFSDGTIGRITIPALNNRVALVRPGLELSTLDYYVGHFPNTSQWDGNIALASHNRGRGSFFAGIWTLQHGDRIFYETTMGVRTFQVVSIEQISETDLSNLNHSHANILSLITCVFYQPSLRWHVRAYEVI